MPSRPTRRAKSALGPILGLALFLSGCAAIEGYPEDPADHKAIIDQLTPYLNGAGEDDYAKALTAAERRRLRDVIVLNCVRLYDIEFDRFERSLYETGSSVSAGSDLATLILNGIGATTGNAGTKSALAAAAAGITGGAGVLNKDLFYQRTLPAVLAQMEANRAQLKAAIFRSLLLNDDDYPLLRARIDLDELSRIGSLPRAINGLTQSATDSAAAAEAAIDTIRTLKFSSADTTRKLIAWLYPKGEKAGADKNNLALLVCWMASDSQDPVLASIPWPQLVWGTAAGLEADRGRFLARTADPKCDKTK